MRIRKRFQNPLPPPDLSSPPPQSAAVAAAAVAQSIAAAGGAGGGQEGEAMAVAAAGEGGPVSGGGCGGRGGRGLHQNGPTTCLPFHPLPPTVAAAGGGGDLPPPGPRWPKKDVPSDRGHGGELPKREQDGEKEANGDAHRRWNMEAHSIGGNVTSPKSFGAEAFEASVGHGGNKLLPSTGATVAAEAMGRWSDEEREPALKRGRYHAGTRRLGLEEEEEEEEKGNVAAKRKVKPKPNKTTRRRRNATSSITTMVATGCLLTSATSVGGGASTVTGADAAKCNDVMVKEEGGAVMPATVVGNGKKRRSSVALMEGSRCSRVNGRGWRCCQQTLVGYSLCEHHLGKGRLRSVSIVQCNGRARNKEEADGEAPPPPSLLRQQDQLYLSRDGEDEEEEKPGRRRRNKIGIVKARSISSLLHQPDHPTITAPAPSPSPSQTPATAPAVTAAAPPLYGTDTAVA